MHARLISHPDPALTDGDLVLRPWRLGDVRAIASGCDDPDIARFTRIPQPYARRDARAFVVESKRGWRTGSAAHFAMVESSCPKPIGSIGLSLDWHEHSAEAGYWVRREFRGRGRASAALRLVSRWAIEALGLHRVALHADVGNVASQHVAENAGYTREGVLRSLLVLGGEPRDCFVYSLIPADLEAQTGVIRMQIDKKPFDDV
ncbi:MAG: GNAT family N-acetyltransferase, partial [Gaiellales bacterium]